MTMIVMDFDETGQRRELLWDAGDGALSIGNAATWPDALIAEELEAVDNNYSIPKVSVVPVIDGQIDPMESQSGELFPDFPRASGGIYMAATEEAIYWAAQIIDPDITITNEFGTASNAMDGVQMLITLEPDPVDRSTAILWDFTAATMVDGELTGPANVFARFALSGYDPSWGVVAEGSFTEDGFIIQVKMPWLFLQKGNQKDFRGLRNGM